MSRVIAEPTLEVGDEVIIHAEGTHTVFRVYWNGERWYGSEGEFMSDVIDRQIVHAEDCYHADCDEDDQAVHGCAESCPCQTKEAA